MKWFGNTKAPVQQLTLEYEHINDQGEAERERVTLQMGDTLHFNVKFSIDAQGMQIAVNKRIKITVV